MLALGLLLSGFQAVAVAAELDCGELAGRLGPGDDYRLRLELQSQEVRLDFGDDYCSEPATAWFDRQLILPPPARRKMTLPAAALEAPGSEVTVGRKAGRADEAVPLPGQKTRQGVMPDLGFGSVEQEIAPLPIRRAKKPPQTVQQAVTPPVAEQPAAAAASGVRVSSDPEGGAAKVTKYRTDYQNSDLPAPEAGVAAAPKKKDESKPAFSCDRELTDFWKAGEHMVSGQKVRLTGVFTVDLDNDGRVDNVGFKIGASGRIGNVLSYFPVKKGRLSARSIPTLKLDNDDDIYRLCAGDVTFSTMTRKDKQKAVGSAMRRQKESVATLKPVKKSDTVAEKTTKDEAAAEENKQLLAEKKTEKLLFWAIVIASAFFLMGGVGLFFAIRNMRSRDEEDDDDDDDDEYEEE